MRTKVEHVRHPVLRTLLWWGGLALATPLMLAETGQADGSVWTVQSGDALSILADRFGCTVDDLRAWNNIDGDHIYVGQKLRIGATDVSGAEDGSEYIVRAGDTLSAIAVRFGVTVDDLERWNEGVDPNRIRDGEHIRLRPVRHRIHYRVRAGDNLSRIARRHRVTLEQIREWNPPIRSRQILREGQSLTLFTVVPPSTSVSVGLPYRGRLSRGVRLPRHRGYVIRNRELAYGTLETVRWITEAFDAVRQAHPRAPRARVHDISDRNGGFLSGHRSHQSGRDADISLFLRRGCRPAGCPFRRSQPSDIHAAQQWTLLKSWLENDRVEAIFLDYSLQRPLYEEARRQGATREQLHRWFQYPRGRGFPLGVVRHYRKHDDHLHVRFRCHASDPECR